MRRQKFSIAPSFERLENRRLWAGDISFANHILTIAGAGYDDIAQVRFEGDRVYADLTTQKSGGGTDHRDTDKRISDVEKIEFNGFEGNDTLTVFVNALNSGVTLANVSLEFHGGPNDDRLIDQVLGGVKTMAWGDAGQDILFGSRFDDVLEGGAGDDELHGGGGSDRYVFTGLGLGEDGILDEATNSDADTLDFTNYEVGVNVNLAAQFDTHSTTPYAVDSANLRLKIVGNATLENALGTAFHDVLAGNSRDNWLSGGSDADDLAGAGGNDTLDGGAGNDSYYFAGTNLGTDTINEAAAADVDTLNFVGLGSGLALDLTKYGSSYAVNSVDLKLKLSNSTAIENVYGTMYADTLIGNSRNNTLWGLDGDDSINGAAGADYLYGGNHDDHLYTDALDQAFGEAGSDWFDKYAEANLIYRVNPQPSRYRDWGALDNYRLQVLPTMPLPPTLTDANAPTIYHPARPETPEIQ